jgi:hypothetical protein
MAAGLGFKTFNTGDVLSAADTNGYLMQGVLVFADAAARDAAITSPQEGQCCYLKDTDAVQTYSGTAWVGFDDSNAIQNAIVDAKGDIVAASGNDTPARLAVGSDGDTLVADSAATTGLRYQASQAAGRNYAINGGTDIWQRGTSFTPTAGTVTQLSDRWSGVRLTSAGWTVSQKTSATDSGVAGSTYFMRTQRNSGNTDLQDLNIAYNNLEGQSFIPLQGQSVTISFYAKAGANYSAASSILNVVAVTGTTADTATWSISGTTNSTTRTLTTSWQRFSYTIAFGATDKAMRTQFYYTPVGTAGANDFFDIWGLQIEYGSVATAFTKAGGTLQGELAACQRYYQRFYLQTDGHTGMFGNAYSTTAAAPVRGALVDMRVSPTTLDYLNVNLYDGVTFYAITGLSIWSATRSHTFALLATGAVGLTQYRAYYLVSAGGGGFIGFGAEL